jgi:excisionase family DNA binding protein
VNERLMSPKEAALQLGISTERLRQLARAGRIDYLETPLGRLFLRDDVERLRNQRAGAEVV